MSSFNLAQVTKEINTLKCDFDSLINDAKENDPDSIKTIKEQLNNLHLYYEILRKMREKRNYGMKDIVIFHFILERVIRDTRKAKLKSQRYKKKFSIGTDFS
jgi:hypothetical protein